MDKEALIKFTDMKFYTSGGQGEVCYGGSVTYAFDHLEHRKKYINFSIILDDKTNCYLMINDEFGMINSLYLKNVNAIGVINMQDLREIFIYNIDEAYYQNKKIKSIIDNFTLIIYIIAEHFSLYRAI